MNDLVLHINSSMCFMINDIAQNLATCRLRIERDLDVEFCTIKNCLMFREGGGGLKLNVPMTLFFPIWFEDAP